MRRRVREVRATWTPGQRTGEPTISDLFESLIVDNLAERWVLEDWKVHTFLMGPKVTETIIAIFCEVPQE